VYSEDEYLGGAGLELTDAGDWPAAEPAVGLVEEELPVTAEPGLEPAYASAVAEGPAVELAPGDVPIEEHIYGGFVQVGRRGARLRRIAGVAMLAGAVGTVGGVVALNISRARQGAGRRPGSLVAQSSRDMSSPVLAGSRSAPSSAPSAPAVVAQAKAPSFSVAHAGRRERGARSHLSTGNLTNFRTGRRGGSGSHTPRARRGSVPAQSSVGVGVRRDGGVAIVLDYSPSTSMNGSTAASSSADINHSPTASAAVGQGEFGFER
jgi:hypothetical protein